MDEKYIDEDEIALFRNAMGDVKPLDHDVQALRPNPPAPEARQRRLDEQRVLQELRDGGARPWDMETGEELLYRRSGLQERVLRRLRRGHFPVDAELDLHGMSVSVAKDAVSGFLGEARRAGRGCVRIIHGKGHRSRGSRPVLKGKLDRWLRQRNDVLAFSSARPDDGGTGAVYVLLSRRA